MYFTTNMMTDLPQGQTNFCKHREDHDVSKCDTCCPATELVNICNQLETNPFDLGTPEILGYKTTNVNTSATDIDVGTTAKDTKECPMKGRMSQCASNEQCFHNKCDCTNKYCKHYESDFDRYIKENPAKDTNVPTKGYVETVLEQFDELLSHYKSSFDGKNSAVNRMRRRTNDILEQEIKIFISTSLVTLIERQISEIEKLIEDENDKLKVRFFHGLPYNLNYTDGLLKSILLLQSFLPTNEIKK